MARSKNNNKINKNHRCFSTNANTMNQPTTNRSTACTCPGCTTGRPHPQMLGHRSPQDVQNTIDYQWNLFKIDGFQSFLLTSPKLINLKTLVEFWSHEKRIENTICGGDVVGSLSGSSLFMSLHYLFLGKLDEARSLLLNGAFLGQLFHIPIKSVIRLFQQCPTMNDQIIHKELPFYYTGYTSISTHESMEKFLQMALPPHFLRRMTHACNAAKTRLDCVEYISNNWSEMSSSSPHHHRNARSSSSSVASNKKQQEQSSIELVFQDATTHEEHHMTIGTSTPLKILFNNYSEERGGISLRSFRFTYQDKTLFLSSISHKTPEQLGIKNLDAIVSHCTFVKSNSSVSSNDSANNIKSNNSRTTTATSKKKKSKSKKKKSNKITSSSSSASALPTFIGTHNQEDQHKLNHSKALTRLFEEAESKFKDIRQKLNSLNLERTKPKNKSSSSSNKKKSSKIHPIPNPSMQGLGGKAGKIRYVIQVGQVDNLYKTSKQRHQRHNNHTDNNNNIQQSIITTDLHGMTKTQALSHLEEHLPQWTDIAMKGNYPFVQPVIVVCGAGNQILSQVVEEWIKKNECVSNAPKNMLLG